MIYIDTSVALAHLLAEDRSPPDSLWDAGLVASRLLACELWGRIHARDLARTHGDPVRRLLARISLLEIVPPVLDRALHPFPTPVRTLDALHLASILFLTERGHAVTLATYDVRMRTAAEALGVGLLDLG